MESNPPNMDAARMLAVALCSECVREPHDQFTFLMIDPIRNQKALIVVCIGDSPTELMLEHLDELHEAGTMVNESQDGEAENSC
jgi:hypothetical protein